MGKGNKEKDPNTEHSVEGAMGETTESACDAHHATRDLSHERATALDKMVADAVARETTQLTVTFTAILNEQDTVNMPTRLKVTSGAAGIKVTPPFDWTRDKAIYQ